MSVATSWPYNVRVDRIAQDIGDDVRSEILRFIPAYGFEYVTTVPDKEALRDFFTDYFVERWSLDELKIGLARLSTRASAIAMTESNRIHTWGLGQVLLRAGQTTCTTIHSSGEEGRISDVCLANIEGKILDLRDVLNNTFPPQVRDLDRTDVPMVPQHINCRHVLAPVASLRATMTR